MVLLASIAIAMPAWAEQAPKLTAAPYKFKRPVAIKRVEPDYPINAARNGQEGWVQLSYIVDKEGNVQDPKVIAHNGARDFKRAAVRAVKKWKYDPAVNSQGEAVLSCQNTLQLDFRINGNDNIVRPKFYKSLSPAFEAVNSNDLATLTPLVEKIDNIKNKRFNEMAWTHFIKMRFFNMKGDKEQAVLELNQAAQYIKPSSKFLNEGVSLQILHDQFMHQINQQQYQRALETYSKFSYFDSQSSKNLIEHFAPAVKQVENRITSDKMILVNGEISEYSWSHKLSRNQFLISNIQGKIDELQVRCDFKKYEFDVTPDMALKIPEGWGQCHILLSGQPGASFDVYELPTEMLN